MKAPVDQDPHDGIELRGRDALTRMAHARDAILNSALIWDLRPGDDSAQEALHLACADFVTATTDLAVAQAELAARARRQTPKE